ncbi:MAG: uroporphyrinogen-III C-methyltransferase, partial [Desulfovibrio sp.]|nr:uroporphyrinogen-III C-methyltransferase [Desulfovibrio sp.]
MKVYLLGAGPGAPDLITLTAHTILSQADVIVYVALANKEFLNLAKKGAECIYVGKIADQHALPQEEINQLLIQKAKEGKIIARLKGGDPYIFGRGGEEAEALLAANIPFEEVPGISSTIAAPAYAGIPLTHRDLVSSVTFITGHEKPGKENSAINWEALAKSGSTLVFVMGVKNLPNIVERLCASGMDPKTPAAIIYRGTTSDQRSLVTSLQKLPEEACHFLNPSVIVVGHVCTLHTKLNWFEHLPLFGQTIVVTRAREQASALSEQLISLGARVLQCPTIAIAPLKDQSHLKDAIKKLNQYDWLILTSPNAVRIFFSC